jgi:Ca2+-binding RTX toxin-like protein
LRCRTGSGGVNIVRGNAGNTVLDGGGSTDTLRGLAGNDTYVLGNCADVVQDTAGIDTITSTITRSLLSFATIENLILLGNGIGNGSANVITGSAGVNTLDGGLNSDRLLGLGGNDVLIGGAGIDTLTGGLNSDFFVFDAPLSAANRDIVTDFSAPLDTFRLENAGMTKVGPVGAVKGTAFFAGAAAHDADDRIVYNKATGILLYDSNGNLAGGITQLATLTNKAALTAADFVVI